MSKYRVGVCVNLLCWVRFGLFFVAINFGLAVQSEFLLQKIAFSAEGTAGKERQAVRVLKLDNKAITDTELGEIVSNNPELVELTLGGTKVTDVGLEHLVRLKKLRTVRLSKTAITDVAGEKLAKIPTLQNIDVSQTNFGDVGLGALRSLAKLKSLNFYLTNISDTGAAKIKDFSSAKTITRLNVDLCKISDAGVRNFLVLENLEWIHLGGTAVTDVVLDDVVKFKKLKEVIVTKTSVTKSAADKLRKNMPDCKVQDNFSNNITDEQIKQAKELRQKKK
ncbi:MAG: hypothetical protein LBJ00_02925 [Planctomycetaceae bacterium]|jgi:hypothetical protein|nr:hypothetical protein [Planctomycetaceae bacterium]